jgi:hypothetical protein
MGAKKSPKWIPDGVLELYKFSDKEKKVLHIIQNGNFAYMILAI